MLPALILDIYNENYANTLYGIFIYYTFIKLKTKKEFYIWLIFYNIWNIFIYYKIVKHYYSYNINTHIIAGDIHIPT